jgi:hypothetical protein
VQPTASSFSQTSKNVAQVSRLEVISTGARRRWTLAEKQRIVAESYSAPRVGASLTFCGFDDVIAALGAESATSKRTASSTINIIAKPFNIRGRTAKRLRLDRLRLDAPELSG